MHKTFTEEFEKAFFSLNDKQKQAVINYEGPCMVVAGPGTGKTQLLAIRIGYILKNTDAQAHNIIALTYTDAGAIAMRQRLLKFIGPDAYKVNIFTFHAFCASVIRDNVEYFGGYRSLQPVSELETDDILREIIDSFDFDHPLKRLSGNLYFERTRLKHLFDTIKKEGWTIDFVKEAVEQEYAEFKADKSNYASRKSVNYAKGEFKQLEFNKLTKKCDLLLAALDEYEKYTEGLAKRERFDYNDMILWVIDAFKKNPDLLMDYQERYQYFLIDEYQDTNGSQNDLIFLLASYWEKPNLFVVGDDDQSIYRFQGASMGNLLDFKNRFEPEIIVLDNNYRSTQKILESSKKLIENNQERLVHSEGLSKNLKRSRYDDQEEIDIKITRYFNTVHEEKDIVDKLEALYRSGYDLSKVAVIYRKHQNVEEIIKYLNAKNIPIQLKREVNVLHSIEVLRIMDIMHYLVNESERMYAAEDLLFKLLHFEYFGITAYDIAKLSIYCSQRSDSKEDSKRWRDVISDIELLKNIGLRNPDKIYTTSQILENLSLSLVNDTPQVFFERLFTEANILETIMKSPDSTWRLQLVNSYFNFIKEESVKDYTISVKQILEIVDTMNEAKIPINLVKVAFAKNGVQFTTIHSSKGLEYDIVFLIKGDITNWKPKSSNGHYYYPKALTPSDSNVIEEDSRRLFYVAMTRAKNELYISYSDSNEEGKSQEACGFIIELESKIDKHDFIALDDEKITNYKYEILRFQQGQIELLDKNLIAKELENFTLSATALNKYLKCPLSFYFENILRVPGARNKWNGFGSAMHYALELYFLKLKNNPNFDLPSKAELFKYYEDGLNKYRSHFTKLEYENYMIYGKENLGAYYDKYGKNWNNATDYLLELKITDIAHQHVPINGMIDRLMVYPDGVVVYDYKTGDYTKASKKLKPPLGDDDNGGDYWRQIVFYSLLIKEYPYKTWRFLKGYMPFLELVDEDFKEREFEVTTMEQEIVSAQIISTHAGIMNQDFHGCNEIDCRWCTFVQNNGSHQGESLEFGVLAPSEEIED